MDGKFRAMVGFEAMSTTDGAKYFLEGLHQAAVEIIGEDRTSLKSGVTQTTVRFSAALLMPRLEGKLGSSRVTVSFAAGTHKYRINCALELEQQVQAALQDFERFTAAMHAKEVPEDLVSPSGMEHLHQHLVPGRQEHVAHGKYRVTHCKPPVFENKEFQRAVAGIANHGANLLESFPGWRIKFRRMMEDEFGFPKEEGDNDWMA